MFTRTTHFTRKTLSKFSTFALLVALALLLTPQPARAAPTFTVNSAADVIAGGDLKNGICQTAFDNTVCTLRAAIMKANHFPGGGATIYLDSTTYQLNIARAGADDETTGDLNVTRNMSVIGSITFGTIIQGGGASKDRVFHVEAGTLTLLRVTIQNGNCGVICEGGGILVDSGSALTLNNSTVSGSTADIHGGGIYNRGSLTVNNSTFSGNAFDGIFTSGLATITNCTIDSNIVTGIFVICDGCGTRRISNSSVSNNSGGGIHNVGCHLIIINSTVFGNSSGGNGGGILNDDYSLLPGTTSLYNVTIAYNAAGTNNSGGGVYNASGTVNFQNTIIANNVHRTTTPPFNLNDDCGGTLTSFDYNLILETTGCNIVGTTFNNQLGSDPNMGALQDNGGPTPTQALIPPSVAIDGGNVGGCTIDSGGPLTTDQRGALRPKGSRCDIGAYEYGKINQTITFGPLPNKTFGDPPFTLMASASSGLPVTFTAAAQCTVMNKTVSLTNVGSCSITAHQAGNIDNNSAPDVAQSFIIFAKLFLPLILK